MSNTTAQFLVVLSKSRERHFCLFICLFSNREIIKDIRAPFHKRTWPLREKEKEGNNHVPQKVHFSCHFHLPLHMAPMES